MLGGYPWEARKVAQISKSENFTSQTGSSVYSGANPASTNIIRIILIMIGSDAHVGFRDVNNRSIRSS